MHRLYLDDLDMPGPQCWENFKEHANKTWSQECGDPSIKGYILWRNNELAKWKGQIKCFQSAHPRKSWYIEFPDEESLVTFIMSWS